MRGKIWTIVWSAFVGAIVWWIVLVAGFGVMTPGSANRRADEIVDAALKQRIVAGCVALFNEDAGNRDAVLAALKQASSWARDDVVEKYEYHKVPGYTNADPNIADACAAKILELKEG
jgi:hypothetical protein